jgi:hypothetical protein
LCSHYGILHLLVLCRKFHMVLNSNNLYIQSDQHYMIMNLQKKNITPSDPYYLSQNTDVSSIKTCLDTFVFAKGNMGRREYMIMMTMQFQ